MAKTQKRNYNKSSKKNAKLSKKANVRSTRKTSKKRTNKPKSLKRKKTHKIKGGADPKFFVCLLPINPDLRLFPNIINMDEEKALINSILLEENVIKINVAYTKKGINLTTRRNSVNAFMNKYLKRKEDYCANLKKNGKQNKPLCEVEDVSMNLYSIPGMWNARMVVIPLKEEKYRALLAKEKKFEDRLPNWDDINPNPLYEIPSPITKPSGASKIYEAPPQTINATPDPPPRPSLDLDNKIAEIKEEMEKTYVKSEVFEELNRSVTAFKEAQSKISEDTTEQITDLSTNQNIIVENIQELISTILNLPNIPLNLRNKMIKGQGTFQLEKKLRKVSTGQPKPP